MCILKVACFLRHGGQGKYQLEYKDIIQRVYLIVEISEAVWFSRFLRLHSHAKARQEEIHP